jgi:kynurenine--oxoglutarate transaminase/cysteine-S-conjugate beta-lyase/glutamine--phenylpyruvate transaminase
MCVCAISPLSTFTFSIIIVMHLLVSRRSVSGFATRLRRNGQPSSNLFSTSNNIPNNILSTRLDGLDAPTVWHEFSPLASEYKAVNLGQGFPDWNPPPFCIEAMQQATDPSFGRNANQYARSYAHMPLANVLAEDYSARWDKDIDPATQIATASGVTNILYCALQGLIQPGDEVLLMEPAFDIYSAQVAMAGGTCVYCPLRPDMSKANIASEVFTLDMDELRSKITDKTKVRKHY